MRSESVKVTLTEIHFTDLHLARSSRRVCERDISEQFSRLMKCSPLLKLEKSVPSSAATSSLTESRKRSRWCNVTSNQTIMLILFQLLCSHSGFENLNFYGLLSLLDNDETRENLNLKTKHDERQDQRQAKSSRALGNKSFITYVVIHFYAISDLDWLSDGHTVY